MHLPNGRTCTNSSGTVIEQYLQIFCLPNNVEREKITKKMQKASNPNLTKKKNYTRIWSPTQSILNSTRASNSITSRDATNIIFFVLQRVGNSHKDVITITDDDDDDAISEYVPIIWHFN